MFRNKDVSSKCIFGVGIQTCTPRLVRGEAVMNALNALMYLPESFQLVFVGNPKDQSFYNEIVALVDRFALGDRVLFMYEVEEPYIEVSDDANASDGAVFADSPEGLASAILAVARSRMLLDR